MKNNELFWEIVTGICFLYLFLKCTPLNSFLFLLAMPLLGPYRNTIATWIMIRLSPSYRKAKKLYEEILFKKEEFDTTGQGDEKLFEYIRNSGMFRQGSDWVSESWGKPLQLDTILSTGTIPADIAVETFVAFFGRAHMLHKVIIWFSYEDVFYVQSIEFWYHEERPGDFLKVLAKRTFLPPPESRRGRYKVVLPPVVPEPIES